MMLRFALFAILPALALLALGNPDPAFAGEAYGFDKEHSHIIFAYNHVGLSTQRARFRDFDGTVIFDQENPENSSVEVVIDAASLSTISSDLDDVLRSESFFDTATYPEIRFKSTSVRVTGAKTGLIAGELTIKNQTRPVMLFVTLNFAGEHPLAAYIEEYAGAPYAGFSAHTTVLRSDFGVDAYAPLVSDEVDIVIEAELRRRD